MYTRPASVPEDATFIPPGQTFGPGLGVQQATIRNIQAQNAKQNVQTESYYARGLQDWAVNAQQYKALGMRVPPPPQEPAKIVTNVVYSDPDGAVVQPPAGADGLHGAWVWETYA